MENHYLPVLMMIAGGVAVALLFFVLSILFFPRKLSHAKLQPFECGNEPSGDTRSRFPVKFYMVALLFIIFDIEAVFLYPWAILLRDQGLQAFLSPLGILLEMGLFMVVLVAALAYVWRKGALDWE